MSMLKEKAYKLVEELSENQMKELIDFIIFLKLKTNKDALMDIQNASMSSTEFWDNAKDDEVWNNV